MANANDTFTGTTGTALTAHTSDSGHTWALGAGANATPTIQTNALQSDGFGGSYTHWYISAVPSAAEYDVQADYTDTGGQLAICGRCDTAAATHYSIRWNGTTTWELIETIAGVTTVIASYAGLAPPQTAVKLQIRNATKKIFIGGVERASSATNNITAAGRAGVGTLNDAISTIDNWSSTDIVSGKLSQYHDLNGLGGMGQIIADRMG